MNAAPRAIPEGAAMPLLQHLTELRNRIIRMLIWLTVAALIAGAYWEPLWEWLRAPFIIATAGLPNGAEAQLVGLSPQEGIINAFRIGIGGALVFASPLVLWELWAFIRPGLTRAERAMAGPLLPVAGLLFFAGCAFARYLILPPMLTFLLWFNAEMGIAPIIQIGMYLPLVINLMVALGLAFEIPVVTFVLARLGLVSGALMAKWRRHAIVGVTILAAVITPTPDAVNLFLLAVPLYLLYEISVLVATLANPVGRRPLAP